MEKLNDFKAAVMAVMTVLGSFLGWQGIMALVWVACMALDYLSGSIAAAKEGKWSSSVARVCVFLSERDACGHKLLFCFNRIRITR